MNTILKQHCKSKNGLLELDINYSYMYEFNTLSYTQRVSSDHVDQDLLLLCLTYNKKCISSIELFIDENKISINSFTSPLFENKKYNKLLRSMIVQVCDLLINDTKIDFVTSDAINYLSLYTFLQIYPDIDIDIENNKLLETYLNSINKDIEYIKTLDVRELKDLFSKGITIHIEIPINKTNIDEGAKIFSETLTKIVCE